MTFEILSILLVVLNFGVTFSLWRHGSAWAATAEKEISSKADAQRAYYAQAQSTEGRWW